MPKVGTQVAHRCHNNKCIVHTNEIDHDTNESQKQCQWFSDPFTANLFILCKHENTEYLCTPLPDKHFKTGDLVAGPAATLPDPCPFDITKHERIIRNFPVRSRSTVNWPIVRQHSNFICTWNDCYESFQSWEHFSYHFRVHSSDDGWNDPTSFRWDIALEEYLSLSDEQLETHRLQKIAMMSKEERKIYDKKRAQYTTVFK